MSLVLNLVSFGLRQAIGDVVGEAANQVTTFIEQHYRDHSQTLPAALAQANANAWKTLAVALAGDSFCDQVKRFFTT